MLDVLLVDDHPFIGAAVHRLLSVDPGIELHICHDPREAQALAARIRPAVVLIDLVMPEIDGLTLLRRLRAAPPTPHTAFIVLSGNDDEPTRCQARAAGASDVVVKLPSSSELIALIRRHAGAVEGEAGPPVETPAMPAAPSPPVSRDETLDRGAVAALRDADPEDGARFITTLIDLFLEEAVTQLEQLHDAVARTDHDAMCAVAHKLCGSSQTIGARRLAALSGQLESHARRHRGSAVVRVLVGEIVDEFAHVRNALALERSPGGQR